MAKLKDWLSQEGISLLEGWARSGLTDEQIAENIGINVRALYRWKRDNEQVCQALKKGKEVSDFQVENALYESALSGNVTAQIFWLKNRKPNQWRDKGITDSTVKFENDGFLQALKQTAQTVFNEHPGEIDE